MDDKSWIFRTFLLVAQLDPDGIPARLKQARRDAGLTQENVADALHVHKRTVENDEKTASAGLWARLNDYGKMYGVPVEVLLWGEGAEIMEGSEVSALRSEVSEVRGMMEELLARSAPSRQAS